MSDPNEPIESSFYDPRQRRTDIFRGGKTMTDEREDEELNRIIALKLGGFEYIQNPLGACGWLRPKADDQSGYLPADASLPMCIDGLHRVPNYCGDLNAVHEAWLRLDEAAKLRFQNHLQIVLLNSEGCLWLVGAPARQRAEALVRVIEEGKR